MKSMQVPLQQVDGGEQNVVMQWFDESQVE